MNRRDSVSVLAARIAARAVGRTLDDLNGIIFVRDVSYRYNDRELAADSVVIVGRTACRTSLFVCVPILSMPTTRGNSYKEVFAYLQQRFRDYVPTLDGGPGWQAQHPDTVELADGYSQLTSMSGRSIRWSMPFLPGYRSRTDRGCCCGSTRRTTNFRSKRPRITSSGAGCW